MQRKEYKHRDTNNSVDDEFGFNDISEADYNKLRAKEQKKSMPQTRKVKRRKKKKKKDTWVKSTKHPDVWVKISDGLYENQTKRKKREKKKKKINHFKGLGSGSSGRGPWRI